MTCVVHGVTASPSARLSLIDALRGIAATSVVVYHVYLLDLLPHARAPFVRPLHEILAHGYLGVYVFFVLSGFVIAHSIRNVRVTPGYIGRFVLRRSLRLDPPYWVTIAAALVIATTWSPDMVDHAKVVPSFSDVAAHALYAQQFFGIPHIVGVFWTLCLEIQFYVVYVVLVFAAQRLAKDHFWLVFGAAWLVSLLVTTGLLDARTALFLWAWPYFFLGAVTAWHHDGRISSVAWLAVAVSTCVVLLWSKSRWLTGHDAPERAAIAAATCAVLFLAGRVRRGDLSLLQVVTLGRPLQYLGRISYSLYLTHILVAAAGVRLGMHLLGETALGVGEVAGLLIGCTALSVAVAHVMHVIIERPAQSLSRRISLPPGPA